MKVTLNTLAVFHKLGYDFEIDGDKGLLDVSRFGRLVMTVDIATNAVVYY